MSTEDTTQPAEIGPLQAALEKYVSLGLGLEWESYQRLSAMREDLAEEWNHAVRELFKRRVAEWVFSEVGAVDPQRAAEILESIEYHEGETQASRKKLYELEDEIREVNRKLARSRDRLLVAARKRELEKLRDLIERQEARLRGDRLL